MLVISRKAGQSLIISDNIKITLLSIGNEKVSIGIDAPRSVSIMREELIETIEVNKESAEQAGERDVKNIATLLKSKNSVK